MIVRTREGRDLDVEVHGPDAAPLVLVHHGTPGSSALSTPYRDAADALGLRLAAWCRPGYGQSTRAAGRDIAAVAPDAVAVADALGAPVFATTGGSGGGPHALALGALLPARCLAVATVASAGPWDADDLDPLAGMGEGNLEEFGAAAQGEQVLRPLLETWRSEMLAAGLPGMLEGLDSVLSRPDLAVLTGEVAAETWASFARGLAPGVDGWADDDLAFLRPWGFRVEDIGVPVDVWQGDQDLMVPPAHGRWLAGRVPGVRAHLLPDDGHVTLNVTRARDVLAPLAAALEARPAG